MGLFDFFKHPDTDGGVALFLQTPGAVLLDVRTPEEYGEGHIPGSRNLPLQALEHIAGQLPDKNTPLFVYCRSGGRSRRAAAALQHMGYTRVTDIGGIAAYTGKVEY